MKTPISESVGIVVTRFYGGQKSRVQTGQNLTPLLEQYNAKEVLLAELNRLRAILDEKENKLKKQEAAPAQIN